MHCNLNKLFECEQYCNKILDSIKQSIYCNNSESYSRKCFRVETNKNMLHRLLTSSDSLISSHRKLHPKQIVSFLKEILQLLTIVEPILDLVENSLKGEN